jgi:hypothetical protein
MKMLLTPEESLQIHIQQHDLGVCRCGDDPRTWLATSVTHTPWVTLLHAWRNIYAQFEQASYGSVEYSSLSDALGIIYGASNCVEAEDHRMSIR